MDTTNLLNDIIFFFSDNFLISKEERSYEIV
jgi:hypothetical protein